MNLEAYWAQTRRKWMDRVIGSLGSSEGCGFCDFAADFAGTSTSCSACPVVKVYGVVCGDVDSVQAYGHHRCLHTAVEKLSVLAEAVVRELDERKAEFIEAMREVSDASSD